MPSEILQFSIGLTLVFNILQMCEDGMSEGVDSQGDTVLSEANGP